MCPLGKHSVLNRTVCESCGKGTYSDNPAGSSVCLSCPRGKHLDQRGSGSSDSCISCAPGSYSDRDGLAECYSCPTRQVQAQEGQTSCKDCALEGKIKTNNAAHTTCIDNQALLSTSMVVMMFNKGVALSLAFSAATVFLLSLIHI